MAIDYPNSIDVQEVNDEIWFDIINRTITLKEGQSIQDILVQNDANSRNFGFMIQRYFENEDLSTKNIRIHYINSLNQHDFAFAHSIEVVGENKDVLSFQWLISAKVCLEVGNVQFAIEFYDENGYALFTTPAMVSVSKGVYTLGSIPDPDYDWVKSFAESMAGKEDKRNRVKEISNDGDDNHYPTAKAVRNFGENIKTELLAELSGKVNKSDILTEVISDEVYTDNQFYNANAVNSLITIFDEDFITKNTFYTSIGEVDNTLQTKVNKIDVLSNIDKYAQPEDIYNARVINEMFATKAYVNEEVANKFQTKVDKSNVLTGIDYDAAADEIYNAIVINSITQQINEMFATKAYVNEVIGGIENGSY